MTSTRRISVPAGGSGRPLTTTSSPGMSCSVPSDVAEEMMVIGRVGVEVRAARLDHDLAQQPGRGELVQRVVDGRQRHRDVGTRRLAVQLLGGDVAVAAFETAAVPRRGAAASAAGPPSAAAPTRSLRVTSASCTNISRLSVKINNPFAIRRRLIAGLQALDQFLDLGT